MNKVERFRFKKNAKIGSADAEDDINYLVECYVDTGDLSILRNCNDPRRIVLGRTGSGKTAILYRLAEVENCVIQIPPESLALSYVSNSDILNFFAKAGVKLDIFYRLLWRHIFTVELLKARFNIKDEQSKKNFLKRLQLIFSADKKKQKAMEYLENWGKSFWEETEYRIKEVTSTLESELKGAIENKLPGIATLNSEAAERLTEQQKAEVVHRAQHVVNKVQIRQLSDIIDMLAEDCINDPKQKYFITIDRLDENWVEDNLRYRLIRALIETVRDFRKVKYAKIIIAIRNDLLERVFKLTRDAGFQEEKYESLYLNISWDKNQFIEVLDRRIDKMVREQYTKQKVAHKDLLPREFQGKPTINYIIERTMMRPRDIILFFNTSLLYAEGSPTLNKSILEQAEGEYSKSRIRSLADEWYADYPELINVAMILKKRPFNFKIKELPTSEIEDFCLNFVISGNSKDGIISKHIKSVTDDILGSEDFRKLLISIFYHIGLVGLKTETFEKTSWSYTGVRKNLSSSEIDDETIVYIHPAFYRVLGINLKYK